MHRNMVSGKVNLDFLDGYLLSALNDIVTGNGVETSGLGGFYQGRITNRWGGLSDYEERVTQYILANCAQRRVVEVGAGLGTLPIALALNGMVTAAVEFYDVRARTAQRLRANLIVPFPELADKYEFIYGAFPTVLEGTNWVGRNVLVLFTNVGAGWDEAQTSKAIGWCQACSEAILDLALFGRERRDPAEQSALFDRIASVASAAKRVPDLGGEYAHFHFLP